MSSTQKQTLERRNCCLNVIKRICTDFNLTYDDNYPRCGKFLKYIIIEISNYENVIITTDGFKCYESFFSTTPKISMKPGCKYHTAKEEEKLYKECAASVRNCINSYNEAILKQKQKLKKIKLNSLENDFSDQLET